ncbi:MAG: HAMP domain-containing protein, partial [Deltaproteobacteria bacterium]|nr:HAMP domain-containing protein [Deltaproteobacteria bacterium]
MTIRNKLLIGSAISTALAVAVLATILFNSREIAAQNRSRTSFHQILKAVSELDILTYEYVLHHEERAQEQWRLIHESLRPLLAAGAEADEDAPLLARLAANAGVIADAFSHAASSYDRKRELQRDGAPQEQIAAAGAMEDRWVAQLMIASQSMISDASVLSEKGGMRLLRAESRARNLALSATLSLVACLLIVWFAVARSVTASLGRLHQATDRIGLGDLSYRIGLDSRDELGALARAFDGMAEKLSAVTVSRDRLLEEVAEREQAEEALQKAHDELTREVEERTREVRQKEVLLKEVHHRVKNNLQVISSLVNLQADGSADQTVREVLKDVTDRVRSMALVHEKLYQSADLARIDFAEYSRSLLAYLWRSQGAAAADVRLVFDLAPVSLPVDTAVPCGLILNELAGNALKHAFPHRGQGPRSRSSCEVVVQLSS